MTDELRARVRAFAASAAPRVDVLDERPAAARALGLLADEDLIGWAVPARDGGRATDLCAPEHVSVRALCAVRSELAYASGMLDVTFVMQGLGSYPIALAGDEDRRASVLGPVAEGKLVAAFALTETGAGSSLDDVATRAERTDTGWRLAGQKTFISNAGIADFYCVLARTSGEPGEAEGLSMFHVPADARGLEVRPFEVMAPHPIGEVIFNDVVLGGHHLLGEEGEGRALALATLHRFRTSVAAAANGFARRALDESVRHLEARRQFGRPLSSFQGLRFDLAEMDVRLRAAELLVAEAAAAVDNGEQATAEVARAKLFATETASWIADRAVQHLGGLGVRVGGIVERLYREVRALRIYEGTSEVQKLIIAKELLARSRDEPKRSPRQ